MEVSANGQLTGTYIGAATYTTNMANPFTYYVNTTQTIRVNHDNIWMSTSVGGNLGW